MRIRRATEGDKESFLQVYMAYKDIKEYSYPENGYVRKYFKWLIDRDPNGVIVAEAEETAGFIAVDTNSYRNKEIGHIHELVIRPDFQNRGVGSVLLQKGINYISIQKL